MNAEAQSAAVGNAIRPVPETLKVSAPATEYRKWFEYKMRSKIQAHAAKHGVPWGEAIEVLNDMTTQELRSCLEQGDITQVTTLRKQPSCRAMVAASNLS